MYTNEDKKTDKVKYTNELMAKRDELTKSLVDLKPGTAEFKDTRDAIEGINRILNERTNTRMNILKIGGMLLLTVVGLGCAHWDDISDSVPGKFVGKFVDGLFNRISK